MNGPENGNLWSSGPSRFLGSNQSRTRGPWGLLMATYQCNWPLEACVYGSSLITPKRALKNSRCWFRAPFQVTTDIESLITETVQHAARSSVPSMDRDVFVPGERSPGLPEIAISSGRGIGSRMTLSAERQATSAGVRLRQLRSGATDRLLTRLGNGPVKGRMERRPWLLGGRGASHLAAGIRKSAELREASAVSLVNAI